MGPAMADCRRVEKGRCRFHPRSAAPYRRDKSFRAYAHAVTSEVDRRSMHDQRSARHSLHAAITEAAEWRRRRNGSAQQPPPRTKRSEPRNAPGVATDGRVATTGWVTAGTEPAMTLAPSG
jgi:hypothetical protein